MAQQIVIIDGLIPSPWFCIQATASGSIMQKIFFIAFLLRHVGNMRRVNAAEGKLGQLWLMHHIHINILVQLPEAEYEFAIFNTL